MASNYPTFELGLFDDIQELDNASEMVETSETSDKSKDQQLSESATPRASLTLPSCSPNYPRASRIGWTLARYCPFLKRHGPLIFFGQVPPTPAVVKMSVP